MKIECLLLRKGGTRVLLGVTDYHFKPDAKGRHVADVKDVEHVGVFAGIKEGYRLLADEDQANPPGNGEGDEAKTTSEPNPDGFDKFDRAALSDLYRQRFNEFPASALTKPKIIEALRQPVA